MARKLPFPPKDIETMKKQINDGLDFIKDFIKRNIKKLNLKYFDYKVYNLVPRFHMVQVDDKIYFVLPNYKSEIVEYKGEKLRPYLVITARSPVGNYILSNYKYLWELEDTVSVFPGD